MSHRKSIPLHILEAANHFDAQQFAEIVKGEFADFPDHRSNQKRVQYPTWYLFLIILCGFSVDAIRLKRLLNILCCSKPGLIRF